METVFQITLSYACFGIVVRNGVVIAAPPIAKWTVGKTLAEVNRYYQGRGGQVCEVGREEAQPELGGLFASERKPLSSTMELRDDVCKIKAEKAGPKRKREGESGNGE